MEKTTRVLRLTDSNNINRDNSHNCEREHQNEKETEVEIDYSIVNSKIVPFILTNNRDVNFQIQYYFSSFHKEMLWPSSNVILYELMLPDSAQLQLNIIELFPRIIATDNKRSKCSVTELLHTLVTLSLGKKSIELCLNKYLYSVMFSLGCETNNIFTKLLQQFIIQILHYLSLKSVFHVHISMKFLEILLQCLNCESNFVIKDYISICIKEYLQSILDLIKRKDQQTSPIYHYTVHKIINLATYPSYNEPLTAAFIFNHLFDLCMNPNLHMIMPNKYWLEFLHSFLINLDKCDEIQVEIALNHIKDTICSTRNIFNAKFPSRRKPSEFANETLQSAVIWLFERCNSPSKLLRSNCIKLFEDLCVHVSNIKSTKMFVDKYGIENLKKIGLKGLKDFENIDMENLKTLARTLDFYIWVFDREMTTPEDVFTADKNEKEKINLLNILKNFISILLNKNVEDTVKLTTANTEEQKKILELMNKVVLKIFAFINSISVRQVKNIIKNIWNDDLCLLVSRFTLCPQKLGFSEQNLNAVEHQMLEKFLAIAVHNLPPPYLSKFKKNFFIDMQEELQNFSDLQQLMSAKHDFLSLKYFLNGIIRLKSCGFINFEKRLKFTFAYTKEKITNIFVTLNLFTIGNNLNAGIGINVIQYLKCVLNFHLLFYKPELAEFMITLISNECSSNSTAASIFFDTFEQPILEFFLINPIETLVILNKNLISSPELLLLFLESLLKYAAINVNDNSKIFADGIVKTCSDYKDLIFDIQYHDRFFKIFRQAVFLSSDPSMSKENLPNPLIPYILKEFNESSSAAKRIEIVDGFIRCFVDDSTASKSQVVTLFKKLKQERLQAPQQLNTFIHKVATMKSWILWEGIVLLTCGACETFFKDVNLVEYMENYFHGMLNGNAASKIELIYAIFRDTNLCVEERLDVLNYFLLPSIESCRTHVELNSFYERYFRNLHDFILEEMNESDISKRKHSLVNKIASYRLFEIMYAKIPFKIILGFHIDYPQNYLNIFLLRCSHETRNFTAKFDEEKELTRLLHCSALNSYIAMVSLQVEKTFQNSIFKEVRFKNHLVWEKIIDCERKYELLPSLIADKLINVMRKPGVRMRVNLEQDDLNDHECMGMIVGIFLYMNDHKPEKDTFPEWMVDFHAAFDTDKMNVVLYLLRVMINARRAFMPCMHLFFESVAKAICFYLRKNKINYLVRDILLMILDAGCNLRNESEIEAGQKLIEALVQQAQDSSVPVCEYNFEIIDNLTMIWGSKLQVPANLSIIMQSDEILAIRIIYVLLKGDVQREEISYREDVQNIVINRIYKWRKRMSPQIIEILGYIMSCVAEDQKEIIAKEVLMPLFSEMRRCGSADFCVSMFYLMYTVCPWLARYKDFLTFINPLDLKDGECKVKCFEMIWETMAGSEPSVIYKKLENMKFIELLHDKTIVPCVSMGFKIIDELVQIFNIQQLLPYARVVEMYAKKDVLIDHKSSAIWFFISVYKKCIKVEPQVRDEHTKNLLTLTEKVLINGVSDPSEEVQEEALDFWRDNAQFKENAIDRLEQILNMFNLEVHSSYAQFLCLLMLDLTNKYPDNQKLLFSPLVPCNYEDPEDMGVIVSPTSLPKNLVGLQEVPIQTPVSPASPTVPTSPTYPISLMDIDDSPRQKIDNDDVRLSKRKFPLNIEIDEYAFLSVITRNYTAEYYEILKSEKLEQENSMKLNRTYRGTYLPDLAINQADVVATIEDYAKKCPSYAAQLSVTIICGLLEHSKSKERYNTLLESLVNMCKKALKEVNEFAPVALEILYKCNCSFDVDDVLKISTSMDLQSLGILILEKQSINYDYADLYGTGKKIASELQSNAYLATLYRSIDDSDVVESIFKNWSLDSSLHFLREGSSAEAEMEWSTAKDAYEEGFKVTDGVVKDYCMVGMFDCLSRLSSWSEINKTIEAIVYDKDYNLIWQYPNKDQLLPWVFKVKSIILTGRDFQSDFTNLLEAWVNEKSDSITRPYGEELSLFFLCNGDNTTARKCLYSTLQHMRGKWTYKALNQRVLDKFKRLSEIESYINAVEKDPSDGAKELISLWGAKVPKIGDDLLNWSIRLNYRLTFASLLSNRLTDVSMDSGIVSNLTETSIKQRLLVNDLALKYKNLEIARKYSLQIRQHFRTAGLENESIQKLSHQFDLTSFRYALFYSNTDANLDKRFSYLVGSWNKAIHLYEDDQVDVSLRLKICHQIFELVQALRSWVLMNDTIARRVAENKFINQELKTTNPKALDNMLFNYSFNTLKDICQEGSAKDMAESYTKLAEYCQKLTIDVYDRDDILLKEFLFSLLLAMSFGSTKAIRYFPCLLKHSIYRNNELMSKIFIEKCQAVPSKMFLDWQEEIISHLATPLAPQVLPIVKKLCSDFPSAIILTLWKTRAKNPIADELYKSVFTNSKYDTFFCAMEYLCQPEEYLRHRLLEFINSIDNNKLLSEAIDLLMSQVVTNVTLQSTELKNVLTNNTKVFEKLSSTSDATDAKKIAKQLFMDLQNSMVHRMKKTELTTSTILSHYSPFLNDFSDRDFDVDVPVQYNYLKQRPKIVRIDRFVQVLPSKSLVIKIIGSDGKTYEFLVKCGFDLRQNQKIQRIFKIANETLKNDLNCRNRHLSVNMFNVVPISSLTGLVQWISNVKSLDEVIEYTLVDKLVIQTAKEKYQEWINHASENENSNKSLVYKRALVKYSVDNVSEKLVELTANIKPNLIQCTFHQISLSLDSYFKIRQNFIRNYATMCLINWLFGVGDRRLKNILVDIFNGDCFGTNFNLIFGASAELPVPELVPFRLTAQIINFMKPFGEKDLFSAIMCHVLKAMITDSNLIIGCSEAFLEEPIKWNVKLNHIWKQDDVTHNGVEWSPLGKIEIIKQKLRCVKPSKILTDELSRVHKKPEDRYFALYQMIVNGNERFHTTARSLLRDHELLPEEQVLCLLDLATDVNTVGRMWADWKCFV
ncbi:DNA-dependent protein kinase catalytic subunit-like [Phymastichus coffea]|uniref:DNA-dependent protein kinase catalytic subunit-like n=1 Tax=Phymastichus coffea TaxID=108790 RepID=UPI00273AB6C1|nr:DNA-dependent protein kinase catalytic subunit-like [Phymastichus coffea]